MLEYPYQQFIRKVLFLCFLFVGLLLPYTAEAQQGTFFNERDNQYLLLGLKRAKVTYEASRTEYERQQDLFGDGLISQSDLDRSLINFTEAEVNY